VRAGPAFRPFASRGRRAVAAILATFALFSAVSVGLSIWATSRSQYKASVLEVAARQRTLSERYLREVLLAREGEKADPAAVGALLDQSARTLPSTAARPPR
jgi:nitrate/nitrite-specific signal transduction histidine kinase